MFPLNGSLYVMNCYLVQMAPVSKDVKEDICHRETVKCQINGGLPNEQGGQTKFRKLINRRVKRNGGVII